MGTRKIIRHSPFVFRCGGGDDGGGCGGDTLVLRVLRFQSQGATLVGVVGMVCLWFDDNNDYDCHSCTALTAHQQHCPKHPVAHAS